MTHKIYHSLIAALIGAATTGAVQAAPIPAMGLRFVAAEAGDSSISVRSARVLPHERSMIVSMCIRVDRDLKGTESIELRPVLTDSTGHSAVLPSIFINGRTQHIAFQRDRRNAKRDLVTLRRRNGMEQTIDYLREVAYQPWMRKATLVLEEVACGCGIPIAYDSHAVATLRSDDTPRLAFRIPEVEEVKTRQESGRAFLAFQLGKSEILDNFRSNATELAKIMQAIDLVKNDSNVTVSHIAIHGYASPDGSLSLNEKLSAERTQALKSWVMSKYQFDEALFTTAHTAEDWEGLVNFLRNNNTLEGREEILNIIATVGDLDKREARIREEFPSQYRFMLDNWYPFLRHSDYTVGYIVRPFTVEEAKRELKLHPQNLSIDEMFRIAQTYKEGSKEYNEVFLIAVKQNPDHPVANLNAACALTSCDWVKDDLSDCPECQGTLSVKIEHRYNMLHADAASSRVEKADVFIRNTATGETQHKAFDKAMLDASGYYADMEFAGAGTYDCLVWSGIDNKIFDWDTQTVSLATQQGDTIARRLPLIFHGKSDATNVELRSDNLATVDMMQDTKFVNVTFNYNGSRHVQDTDFLLTLSAPNSILDASNNTAADHATTYKPYGARTESIDHQQVVSYALSTLRLMEKDRAQCRLRLDYHPTDGSQGQNLFDIPLLDYLLMCKDFEGERMTTQEYLDRQSTYHIVFLIRDTGNPHAPFAVSVLSVNNWQMRDDQPVVKTN